MSITLRRADPSDAAFLVEAILAAEKVPGDSHRTVYELVHGFTADELPLFLSQSLVESHGRHPLSVMNHWILEQDGRAVASCAAWVEADGAGRSGLCQALLASRFLGPRRWRDAQARLGDLGRALPSRSAGALQLESFYVVPSARGRGHTRRLIAAILDAREADAPGFAEISCFQENLSARWAYKRSGFAELPQTNVLDEALGRLLGSRGFVQLTQSLSISPPRI